MEGQSKKRLLAVLAIVLLLVFLAYALACLFLRLAETFATPEEDLAQEILQWISIGK